MFLSRNKKNNVYPCKPQFYYIKVRLNGSKWYRHIFVMLIRWRVFWCQILVYAVSAPFRMSSINVLGQLKDVWNKYFHASSKWLTIRQHELIENLRPLFFKGDRCSKINLIHWYIEPLLQRHHLFPKTLPLKRICWCTEYLMSRRSCFVLTS